MLKNKPGFLRIFSRHPSHSSIRNLIKVDKPIGLRLGSNTPCEHDCLNSVEGVENSSNKLLMKDLFLKAGISSPSFFKLSLTNALLEGNVVTFEELGKQLRYPVLAKRTFRSKGIGMLKINNYEEYLTFIEDKVKNKKIQDRNPYYLETFHNYSREYRLHISENGCFYSCRKMLKEGGEKRWMRNDSNSIWITEKVITRNNEGQLINYEGENELFNKPDTWDNIVTDCNNARIAVGLNICCFDVKVNRKGDWIILESNSAPSFGEITKIMYGNELIKLINNV